MDQTLSLGWMQSEAAARRAAFRRVLGVNLVLQGVIGVAAVLAPGWLSALLGLGGTLQPGWVSAWGGMLLLVAALYLPGYQEPARARWPNLVGILGRFGFALLYVVLALGGAPGFLWLAAFDLGFGVSLAMLYLSLGRAELMSRP
ncbi:hypothetical protein GXW74_19225 [Roseomonas eburnea]|uniref:Uncharacterized protein n=1 Tax=Neoroseomonas eburnea TaxID=1346889 RepID=A0A9X9XFZ7_9PROT|nr:hypothetical protein [Neoroseomonas eburnea]MBR0682633.1 hypothetical protein [Neoroseomonas eburnea]